MSDRQTLRLDPDDPTKTNVKTRDGREARILAIIEGQDYPIIGMVKNKDGEWWPDRWKIEGSFRIGSTRSPLDLVNAPRRGVGYINIYGDGLIGWPLHDTRESADNVGRLDGKPRIACVRIKWEEGQFDG